MAEPVVLPPARQEHRDVAFGPMLIAFVLMLVALGAIVGLALWLFPRATADKTASLSLPRYPAPVLQPSPRTDMAAFRAEQRRRLNGTGWVDRERGIVHIPIEDAMRDVARTGIPGWPAGAGR